MAERGGANRAGTPASAGLPSMRHRMKITRMGCPSCSSQLSGVFKPCDFCALGPQQREILLVFLRSRGNLKELERHLQVSYPTARARFEELLAALGLAEPSPDQSKLDVLRTLARGEIDVNEATARLGPQ